VKSHALGERFECESVESIELGLNKFKPDVVSICTPDDTHFNITSNLLHHELCPKVIFLEKPVCRTRIELDKLIQLANLHNKEVVINHSRRFDENHQILKERIFNNEFGELIVCEATYYNGWLRNGVHVVDAISYLFNDTLKVEKILSASDCSEHGDPTLDISMSFKNSSGIVSVKGFDEKYYQICEFDFKFEKARLRIGDFGKNVYLEIKRINQVGENILVPMQNNLPTARNTPMGNAVNLISEYIISGNADLLHGYRLQDTMDTMRTLWEGLELYDSGSQ